MTVGRDELEAALTQLCAEVVDPQRGIHGPGSMGWRINREAIVFLAGGRAALLQLAHPAVATAIDQHSRTRRDPVGRFRGTFGHVYAMTFGDLDTACRAARRVHAIHRRIVGRLPDGRPYDANAEEALFWVQATLIESALLAFELVVEPLTADEKERYYQESRRFGRLFGIPDRVIPSSYGAFLRYCDDMARTLAPTAAAQDMGQYLLRPPGKALGPLAAWYRVITAGLLPAYLRPAFGLRWGRRERLAFELSVSTLRRAYRRLPPSARFVPFFHDAQARLRGGRPPDAPLQRITRSLFSPDTGEVRGYGHLER